MLVKLRTMTDERDVGGALLPEEEWLTSLGRTLRATSLQELPELCDVVRDDWPGRSRPLSVAYVERHTSTEVRSCDVRRGITGWAQVNPAQHHVLGGALGIGRLVLRPRLAPYRPTNPAGDRWGGASALGHSATTPALRQWLEPRESLRSDRGVMRATSSPGLWSGELGV